MDTSVAGDVDLEVDEEELEWLVLCVVSSSSSSSLQPLND